MRRRRRCDDKTCLPTGLKYTTTTSGHRVLTSNSQQQEEEVQQQSPVTGGGAGASPPVLPPHGSRIPCLCLLQDQDSREVVEAVVEGAATRITSGHRVLTSNSQHQEEEVQQQSPVTGGGAGVSPPVLPPHGSSVPCLCPLQDQDSREVVEAVVEEAATRVTVTHTLRDPRTLLASGRCLVTTARHGRSQRSHRSAFQYCNTRFKVFSILHCALHATITTAALHQAGLATQQGGAARNHVTFPCPGKNCEGSEVTGDARIPSDTFYTLRSSQVWAGDLLCHLSKLRPLRVLIGQLIPPQPLIG